MHKTKRHKKAFCMVSCIFQFTIFEEVSQNTDNITRASLKKNGMRITESQIYGTKETKIQVNYQNKQELF